MTTSNGDRKIPDLFGHIQRIEGSTKGWQDHLDQKEAYATEGETGSCR